MLILGRPFRQLYYRCTLLDDFAASVKHEMVVCGDKRKGDPERDRIALGMPAAVFEPREADLFVGPAWFATFAQDRFDSPKKPTHGGVVKGRFERLIIWKQ